MKRRTEYSYVKSKNLINRIFDMLEYFNFFKDSNITNNEIKLYLKNNINNIYFVESIAKYFEDKLKHNYKKIELRCNLKDLIHDLDYLKQYIEK